MKNLFYIGSFIAIILLLLIPIVKAEIIPNDKEYKVTLEDKKDLYKDNDNYLIAEELKKITNRLDQLIILTNEKP